MTPWILDKDGTRIYHGMDVSLMTKALVKKLHPDETSMSKEQFIAAHPAFPHAHYDMVQMLYNEVKE